MNFGRGYGGHLAWLLIATLASCAHERAPARAERPQPAAERPQTVVQAPAPDSAAQDERGLAEQLKRLEAAHDAVTAAQQQLAQARLREDEERSKAQQLQQRVSERLRQANQRAQQAQAAAEQAQGIQNVAGRVVQVTPSLVVVRVQGGLAYTFNVDQRTRVLVGTEQRSIADIQQGAEAQVAYDSRASEPTALTIRVRPAGDQMRAVTPPAESSPPTPAR